MNSSKKNEVKELTKEEMKNICQTLIPSFHSYTLLVPPVAGQGFYLPPTLTAVIVTGPDNPEGKGFHALASKSPFFVFSLILAGILML
jgi:hypothetical protein